MLFFVKCMERNLKKKKMIMDYDTIRECPSNIAKMNIFEMIYCKFYHWGLVNRIRFVLLEDLKGILENLFYLVAHILFILFLPISLPITCYIDVKKTKQEHIKKELNKK